MNISQHQAIFNNKITKLFTPCANVYLMLPIHTHKHTQKIKGKNIHHHQRPLNYSHVHFILLATSITAFYMMLHNLHSEVLTMAPSKAF